MRSKREAPIRWACRVLEHSDGENASVFVCYQSAELCTFDRGCLCLSVCQLSKDCVHRPTVHEFEKKSGLQCVTVIENLRHFALPANDINCDEICSM